MHSGETPKKPCPEAVIAPLRQRSAIGNGTGSLALWWLVSSAKGISTPVNIKNYILFSIVWWSFVSFSPNKNVHIFLQYFCMFFCRYRVCKRKLFWLGIQHQRWLLLPSWRWMDFLQSKGNMCSAQHAISLGWFSGKYSVKMLISIDLNRDLRQ